VFASLTCCYWPAMCTHVHIDVHNEAHVVFVANAPALTGCGLRCRALREQVDLALKGLDLRPRNILRYRYGLHTALGRPLTLNEVRTTDTMPGFCAGRVRRLHLTYHWGMSPDPSDGCHIHP
jgi:hypothetical protein